MADWLRRDNSDPLFWLGRIPVTFTNLLIGLYVIDFVAIALLSAAGKAGWLTPLAFNSLEVFREGQLWQLVTYPLVQPVSVFFIIEMLMLFWFGRELEANMGRKGFALLYLSLVITPMLALSLLQPLFPTIFSPNYAGSNTLHFAVFLAFAAMFPRMEMIFGILAQWAALVLLAVYSLVALARHDWSELVVMWTSMGVATFAIRSSIFSELITWMDTHRERQATAKMRRQKLLKEQAAREREKTIDEILDKISQQGMQSLTKAERATLERARLDLLKKEKR